MRVYAIKNKKGEYLGIAYDFSRYWTELDCAYYFRDTGNLSGLEMARDFRNRNKEVEKCKVVGVEISEVENECW